MNWQMKQKDVNWIKVIYHINDLERDENEEYRFKPKQIDGTSKKCVYDVLRALRVRSWVEQVEGSHDWRVTKKGQEEVFKL